MFPIRPSLSDERRHKSQQRSLSKKKKSEKERGVNWAQKREGPTTEPANQLFLDLGEFLLFSVPNLGIPSSKNQSLDLSTPPTTAKSGFATMLMLRYPPPTSHSMAQIRGRSLSSRLSVVVGSPSFRR